MSREYRQWETIAETITPNPFNVYQPILEKLGLDQRFALDIFSIDFESAVTRYTNDRITMIFDLVYATNHIKYEKLVAAATAEYNPIDNYNMVESGTDTRKPELTHTVTLNTETKMTDTRETSTTGNNNTNTKNKLNQTHTTKETPDDYGETMVHSINTDDNVTLRIEYEDKTTQTGTRTVDESYSGDADTTDTTVTGTSTTRNSGGTSTTNSGTNTDQETGTDTTEHTLTRKGNIGVTTSQQMLESEMNLATKMNIFKTIEQDIAAKLFLQVWL